jgi:glycosyltransferase involved in cell wall biosynthesis
VVAFDVGGISDWLRDGVNGFLVKPKDSDMLASRIESLLRDESRRIEMGQAGLAMVTTRYAESRHVKALLSLFRSLQSVEPAGVQRSR